MQGHVTILGVTPNIEAMIASGGRISTMDGTADEIFETSLAAGREKNEKLIGKVLSSGHTSVLEHGFVNLAFENVSVLAEQFLIEFRLASFTVKSRRYVDFSKAGYVSPELESDAQRKIFDETVRTLFAIYDELEAAGVPKEDARFVLPYCFCLSVWTNRRKPTVSAYPQHFPSRFAVHSAHRHSPCCQGNPAAAGSTAAGQAPTFVHPR